MKRRDKQKFGINLLLLLTILPAVIHVYAGNWVRPPDDIDIFGQMQTVTASRNETLLDVARRYGIGQDEMVLANPYINRWLPEDGAKVVLPLRFIIPQAERTGLIINLPEMRLYYFPKPADKQKLEIITHPVSIGRMDWNTPLGRTTIVRKQKNPTWTPPQSLKAEAISEGKPPLPDIVPPGPDNPLGEYALYLGLSGYLIHSTNKPFGVGMRVTHGCMRLYPEDIKELFNLVPTGTPVQIVNQPVKLGWQENLLFIELHPPLEEDDTTPDDYKQKVHSEITEFLEKTAKDFDGNTIRNARINSEALEAAIHSRNGIPTLILENQDY